MPTITTYLYNQNVDVVAVDTAVGTDMSQFYTPNIKVYRGIDNDIRVNLKNRDQKPVSILDKTVTLVIIDKETSTTTISRTVEAIDPHKGVGKIKLTEGDMLNLDAKFYTYAFKVVDGEDNTQIGYSDDTYGANGTIELVEGVYPTFKESTKEDFSAGNTGSTLYLDQNINRNSALHTAVVSFSSAFTGTLQVQGTLNPTTGSVDANDFITIDTKTYSAQEDNVTFNWTGVYAAIRFVRATTTGTLSQVLYRP